MDRALVIVNESETSRRLLSEAGSLAAGVDAKLFVLGVVDADEYESDVQRKASQGTQPESLDDVTEAARQTAEDAAESAIADVGIEYQPIGLVGDLPEDIVTEANERDCDHVFVVGRRRSPTGKVLFGDLAQSMVLNFDGPVTVLLDD